MTTQLSDAIKKLGGTIKGRVLSPDDDGYD